MKRQKSYIDKVATLYLVPTPIGNYLDMTYRSVETLKNVSVIYAEDTRVTKMLLSHFNIYTPLYSYHAFNEDTCYEEILDKLSSGMDIALVSDAGMPCISDPGFLISREAIKAGYNVIALPGASASLTALVGSGMENERFYFVGFLNRKESQRKKEIESLKDYPHSLIIYEAPHRFKETINNLYTILGDRKVVVARELTKKYEEYLRGTLSEIYNLDDELKGEIVIILEGAKESSNTTYLNSLDIMDHLNYYIEKGASLMDAKKMVAKDRGVSKSVVYKLFEERND